MAVGTTTALLLGGAASALIGGNAAKNAAKTTANAARDAAASSERAAQTAAQALRDNATQNNALLEKIYGQNSALLQPSINTGTAAQDAINAFLGLPVYRSENDYEGYVDKNPDILANFEKYGDQFGGDKAAFGKWFSDQYGDMNPAKVGTRQVLDTDAPERQAEAFGNFRDATGFQFAMDNGLAAVDQSKAARGLLNSGKAVKDVQKFGSDLATQSAGQYLNYLTGQQSAGSSARNLLASLSSNFGANVSGNNNAATSGAANALLNATGASNNYLTGAAETNANAGLAGANQLSNLLGQAVSAYGGYSGTSSYSKPSSYGTFDANTFFGGN